MDREEKMEDKILLGLSKENMQDLYDACVSYREELYGVQKKLTGLPEAQHAIEERCSRLSGIIIEISNYMEEE